MTLECAHLIWPHFVSLVLISFGPTPGGISVAARVHHLRDGRLQGR